MRQGALEYLTDHDWNLLLEKAETLTFPKGETILAQGSQTRSIYLLVQGYASVESSHAGQGIYLNQIGPGEIFGEISFLENLGATASVIASETAEVQVITEQYLLSLLNSVPGLATRFYHSLALTLAQRLRQSIARFSSFPETIQATESFLSTSTVDLDPHPIPAALISQINQCRAQLFEIEQSLIAQEQSPEQAEAQVFQACDQWLQVMGQYSQPESCLDGDASVGNSLRHYLFRETFPLLMQSATLARCQAQGQGYGNDYQIGELIENRIPQGAGAIGASIDAWFLSRPFCQGHRQGRQLLGDLIAQLAIPFQPQLTRVTSLACGNSREIFDLFTQHADLDLYLTCIDPNPAALAFNVQTYRQLGTTDRMTFLQNDIRAIVQDQERLALPPQQIIYGFNLCDRWRDGDVILLLNWIYQALAPQGTAILSSYHPEGSDRLLLEQILNWKIFPRIEESWRDLIHRSLFISAKIQFQTDPTGQFLFPLLTKI